MKWTSSIKAVLVLALLSSFLLGIKGRRITQPQGGLTSCSECDASFVNENQAHSGDVSGIYNALSVDKLKGTPICVTGPTLNQVLKYDGAQYCPAADVDTTCNGADCDLRDSTATSCILKTDASGNLICCPDCFEIANPQNGDIIMYSGGAWVRIGDPVTAGQCWLSGGNGADPAYGTCPSSGGGCTTAVKNLTDGVGTASATVCDDTLTLAGSGEVSVSCGTKTCTITGSAHTPDEVGAVVVDKICRGDGTQATCDLTGDGTGTCAAGSVCKGGHTHPGSEVSSCPTAVCDPSYINEGQAAGGDLAGTYPNPTVDGLQAVGVCPTAPTLNQVLKYDGSQWCPATPSGGGAFGVAAGAVSASASINSTTYVTLVSKTVVLNGSKGVHLTATCHYKNTSGGNAKTTYAIFDGTTNLTGAMYQSDDPVGNNNQWTFSFSYYQASSTAGSRTYYFKGYSSRTGTQVCAPAVLTIAEEN